MCLANEGSSKQVINGSVHSEFTQKLHKVNGKRAFPGVLDFSRLMPNKI
jgi:hypothetical protein